MRLTKLFGFSISDFPQTSLCVYAIISVTDFIQYVVRSLYDLPCEMITINNPLSVMFLSILFGLIVAYIFGVVSRRNEEEYVRRYFLSAGILMEMLNDYNIRWRISCSPAISFADEKFLQIYWSMTGQYQDWKMKIKSDYGSPIVIKFCDTEMSLRYSIFQLGYDNDKVFDLINDIVMINRTGYPVGYQVKSIASNIVEN